MSTYGNGVWLTESQKARFPSPGPSPTFPGGSAETTREARILLRAALELLGKRELQHVAERAVHLATETFATAARLDLLDDDGRLHPVAASDPSDETLLPSRDFDGSHPAVQELIAHGNTGLRAPEGLRRALWGETAVKKEVVLSALTVDRRPRGLLVFMSSPTSTDDAGLDSNHLLRWAFVSIVSRAVGQAEEQERGRPPA